MIFFFFFFNCNCSAKSALLTFSVFGSRSLRISHLVLSHNAQLNKTKSNQLNCFPLSHTGFISMCACGERKHANDHSFIHSISLPFQNKSRLLTNVYALSSPQFRLQFFFSPIFNNMFYIKLLVNSLMFKMLNVWVCPMSYAILFCFFSSFK